MTWASLARVSLGSSIFSAVWLAAILLSIPASFVVGYLVAAKLCEAIWRRVIMGAILGVTLAPFALVATYLLPFTIWVVVLVGLVWALVRAALNRGHPTAMS